jgi:hypothetical protein
MNGPTFSLEPFAGNVSLSGLEITGHIARQSGTLSIGYLLRGGIERLAIPKPADIPARTNGLWENTCLEFFLARKGDKGYWEFNLSPDGHWNVYHFESYRQGMQEETAFGSLPFLVSRQPESVSLDLTAALEKIIPRQPPLEIGVAAVIKSIGGESSYWALTHKGARADFHRRDGFIIELG